VASKGPAELLCRARSLVDRVLAEGVVDFERLEERIRGLASPALETAQLAVCIAAHIGAHDDTLSVSRMVQVLIRSEIGGHGLRLPKFEFASIHVDS
jgi:hypothetical protein